MTSLLSSEMSKLCRAKRCRKSATFSVNGKSLELCAEHAGRDNYDDFTSDATVLATSPGPTTSEQGTVDSAGGADHAGGAGLYDAGPIENSSPTDDEEGPSDDVENMNSDIKASPGLSLSEQPQLEVGSGSIDCMSSPARRAASGGSLLSSRKVRVFPQAASLSKLRVTRKWSWPQSPLLQTQDGWSEWNWQSALISASRIMDGARRSY